VTADPCHVGGITYCALNPAVTAATISQTICVSGWTATVRPASSYTSALKVQQLQALAAKIGPVNPADYEEDHRLPLELGGAPSNELNLSPEKYPGASAKDAAENAGKEAVCAGADLRTTQTAFAQKWLAEWPDYKAVS